VRVRNWIGIGAASREVLDAVRFASARSRGMLGMAPQGRAWFTTLFAGCSNEVFPCWFGHLRPKVEHQFREDVFTVRVGSSVPNFEAMPGSRSSALSGRCLETPSHVRETSRTGLCGFSKPKRLPLLRF
jgi:hypothetical protein